MRNPSEDLDEPHDYSINFWYTTVCRLAFVVVFEVLYTSIYYKLIFFKVMN